MVIFGGIFDSILNTFASIDFVLIAQLTMLALVVIAGPAIVFLLALRGGDL